MDMVADEAVPEVSSNGGMGRCKVPCCETMCSGVLGSHEVTFPAGTQRYPTPGVQADESDADEYILMEDCQEEDQKDAQAFVADLAVMKDTVKGLRKILVMLSGLVVVLFSCIIYFVYMKLTPDQQHAAKHFSLLASIPIVALLFTWFHIWLAIQMMFLPINFVGICQQKSSGMGLGWQGIVPRKAHKMAQTAYISGRPHLDGPKDWMSRVDASKMVAEFRPQLQEIVKASLNKVVSAHFPSASNLFSEKARSNIATSAVDKIQETSQELWKQWIDLLCDERLGVDNDGLIVKVFTENKELLNSFFMKLGYREFRFIEHCGAAMGFVCGLVQLIAFNHLSPSGRALFLPLSGFFLGIVSNWAAIMCVFKPCYPIPVKICGFKLFDIQGLFLKRQPEVAVLYSKLLCEHFLSFHKVVNYLGTKEELWRRLKESYLAYNKRMLKETLGLSATVLAPLALGKEQYALVERDLEKYLVKGLRDAKEIHMIGGRHIAKVTNIERNNAAALKKMPPDEFEDLLHPVFKEDEWILILLGGVLGAIVGIGQVFVLSN